MVHGWVLLVLCCRLVGTGGWSLLGLAVWRGAVASSSAASALAVGRAWPSASRCDGPVDCFQQAFVAVLQSRWEVAFVGVLGGRLDGAASGSASLASSASTSLIVSRRLPGIGQTLDQLCLDDRKGWKRASEV